MRKIFNAFLCLVLLFFTVHVQSQDTSSLQRVPYKLHIDVDKKKFYEENLPAGRFVHPNNAVQLYPGENVYLEADVSSGRIIKLRAVPAVKDSSKTIIASFNQTSKNGVHENMMLKLYNPFDQVLLYKAKMFVMNSSKWADTSILPVEARLWGYEVWPDLIISIAIGEWELK